MSKPSVLEDHFPGMEPPVIEKPKRGLQEDGTYITSGGETLAAKKPKRIPYEEPEDKQADGNVEIVESPDGKISFKAQRMTDTEYRAAAYPERKRQQCRYAIVETYSGLPRPNYSWDELEQIRKGELKR